MTFPHVTIIDVPQRTPEWYAARLGRLTASCAKDMLAKIQKGEAAARRDLRTRLVCERLTGQPQDDGYVNADMQRGIDLEADAFAAYEAHTGHLVARVGFLQHDTIAAGCSPDGVLDDGRGLLELKVPRSATHLRYLRDGGLPAEHAPQILHALWISGAAYCDFCSFDPRFPAHLQLFIVRVERNDFEVMTYGKAAETFLAEVDAEVEAVKALRTVAA